jgi:hypothetical protein
MHYTKNIFLKIMSNQVKMFSIMTKKQTYNI